MDLYLLLQGLGLFFLRYEIHFNNLKQLTLSGKCVLPCVYAQLCTTLCYLADCSLPGFSVHGILQAGILEWVAASFFRGSFRPSDWTRVSFPAFWPVNSLLLSHLGSPQTNVWSEVQSLSRVRLFVTPWTVVYKAPLSMEFSRQEYWSVLPFPSPGGLPDPGIKPGSPALQADTLPSEPPGKTNLYCFTIKELVYMVFWHILEKYHL